MVHSAEVNGFSAIETFSRLEIRRQRRTYQVLEIEAPVIAGRVIVRNGDVKRIRDNDALSIGLADRKTADNYMRNSIEVGAIVPAIHIDGV